MDGASAMKLAERLRDIVEVYPRVDEEAPIVFRSSLFSRVEADRQQAEIRDDSVLTAEQLAAELARLDPAGTVEVVSV
jgi:hypothetical protein